MSGEPLTTEAFMKYIDDLKTSLSDELKTSLSQTIRTEVTAAVAPLLEKHAELADDISSTKVRVTNVETESALTKARVAELEKQVDALKHILPPTECSHSIPHVEYPLLCQARPPSTFLP